MCVCVCTCITNGKNKKICLSQNKIFFKIKSHLCKYKKMIGTHINYITENKYCIFSKNILSPFFQLVIIS